MAGWRCRCATRHYLCRANRTSTHYKFSASELIGNRQGVSGRVPRERQGIDVQLGDSLGVFNPASRLLCHRSDFGSFTSLIKKTAFSDLCAAFHVAAAQECTGLHSSVLRECVCICILPDGITLSVRSAALGVDHGGGGSFRCFCHREAGLLPTLFI